MFILFPNGKLVNTDNIDWFESREKAEHSKHQLLGVKANSNSMDQDLRHEVVLHETPTSEKMNSAWAQLIEHIKVGKTFARVDA